MTPTLFFGVYSPFLWEKNSSFILSHYLLFLNIRFPVRVCVRLYVFFQILHNFLFIIYLLTRSGVKVHFSMVRKSVPFHLTMSKRLSKKYLFFFSRELDLVFLSSRKGFQRVNYRLPLWSLVNEQSLGVRNSVLLCPLWLIEIHPFESSGSTCNRTWEYRLIPFLLFFLAPSDQVRLQVPSVFLPLSTSGPTKP